MRFKTYEEYIKMLLEEGIRIADQKQDPLLLIDVFMTHLLLKKEGIHYFIESEELYKFLQTTELKDLEILKYVFKEKIKPFAQAMDGENIWFYNGYIHAPVDDPAIHFCIFEGQISKRRSIGISKKDNIFEFPISNSLEKVKELFTTEHIKKQKEQFDNMVRTSTNNFGENVSKTMHLYTEDFCTKQDLNFVINTFLYMQAFPEMIQDGAPKGQPIEYSFNKSKIIKTSSHIIDAGGITPHFRRGHFRLLTSNFYTKKKGQVIFIRSTFVGGKAKTIIDNEEKEIILDNLL